MINCFSNQYLNQKQNFFSPSLKICSFLLKLKKVTFSLHFDMLIYYYYSLFFIQKSLSSFLCATKKFLFHYLFIWWSFFFVNLEVKDSKFFFKLGWVRCACAIICVDRLFKTFSSLNMIKLKEFWIYYLTFLLNIYQK